jgi:hypothetical protein
VRSAKAISETRFQYQHITSNNVAADTSPHINVPAAARQADLRGSSLESTALNHTNFGPPVGNLSAPYFGESISLASGFGPPGGGSGGSPTYSRKIILEMRFTF